MVEKECMPCVVMSDDARVEAAAVSETELNHIDTKELPSSARNNAGAVSELCTCVGFLTCHDPESYEDEIIDNNMTTTKISTTLPDPPQPDPPASHTVLVHRTRYDPSETPSMFDESTKIIPMDSFDVIVHSPSRQEVHQYADLTEGTLSISTPATTSTIGRVKRPEEYEPLILLVDDDGSNINDDGLSPKSNRAVRDTSSTSSLQYHRRSPMFLSYASPQHEQRRKRQFQSNYDMSHHKHRHQLFQTLLHHEISKRTEGSKRKSKMLTNTDQHSIQYNKYFTSNHDSIEFREDDDRYGYNKHESIINDRHDDRQNRMTETDTVCAVAPDKNLSLSGHDHYHLHPLPTNQVVIFPTSSYHS
jgi:hypothetical protein